MEYEDVHYETDEGIATITIDRQEAYNAFTRNTVLELNERIREVREDESAYVIVVRGAGDAFCAGADTTSMGGWDDQTEEEYGGYLWAVQNVVRQLREASKPSIAAVNGPAIGAGCDFALACDLRVVGPTTTLREGFVQIGLIPGDGGGWLLPRLVGEAKAKEYLLTGKDINADTAVDLGLTTEVTDEPMDEAIALAARMRDMPAVAVQRTKQLTDPDPSFEEYCARAVEYQWECVNDPEHEEAVAAFSEGRDPEYDRP